MISLGIFLLYYLLFSAGLALTGKGELSPEVGGYIGTVFFMFVSTVLFLRAKS